VAVLAASPAVAGAAAKPSGKASFYTLKNAKAKCKAHYTKQTVTIRVRKHRHWVKVHQVRCVYTGNGSSLGAAPPNFPSNLPTAAVTVTVIPTATPDSYSTPAGVTLDVGASGVLANDGGLELTAELVSGPAHGTLTLKGGGSFRYVPASGFSGIDHFSYRADASAGEDSAPAIVTIHVTPLAAAAGPYSASPGTTLDVGAPGLLAGDTGSGLSASLVSIPVGGSLTLNDDGSFSYTPYQGFAGVDSFQFEAVDADGQDSNVVTVTIDVGAGAPTVVPESFDGAVGNTELQVGGVRGSDPEVLLAGTSALAGDSDPDGGALSATPATITTAQGGTVHLAADGSFTYQPQLGFKGPSDSFSYQVDTSEGGSATATATIGFTGARVWYVQAAAAPGGDGSSTAPFQSLASVSSPGGALASGDTVFLYGGSYGGGVTLASDDTLVGQSAGLWIGNEQLLAASGANPVITNGGGTGISLVTGDAVGGVDVSGSSGAGISVSNAASFTIAANVTISNAGADGLDVSNGNGDATVAAAITGSAGHSVEVSGRQGGTLTFSGAITDTGDGVDLQNNGGATISFTGQLASTTTNSDPAFQALGGGTVTVSGAGSTLSTQDAVALDVESTAIGTAGLTFQTISAGAGPGSGPAEGVLLSDTGNGPIVVTGSNSAQGSGGDIQGTTVAAVSASNTGELSLTDMDMTPQSGDGVEAASVDELAVFSSQVTGGDSGIVATGVSTAQPSFDIELNVLGGQQGTAISLTYGGTSSGYVQQNQIGSESPLSIGSIAGDGIDLWPVGGGTLEADVSANTVDEIDSGIGIDAQAPDNGTLDLTLSLNAVNMDSTSSQDGVQVGSSGTVCVNPTGNDVAAAGTSASANAMEFDQQLSSCSVFEIEGLDTDPVSYLKAVNILNVAAGGGAQALAATNGPAFMEAPSACPAPSGDGHLT
jgi:Bacterial Ig domain